MNLVLEQKPIILELRIHFLSYTFTVTYLIFFFHLIHSKIYYIKIVRQNLGNLVNKYMFNE